MSGYADAIVKVWDIIEQYIAEEANIARSENQPTSRLTSLYMKLSNYLKQLNK